MYFNNIAEDFPAFYKVNNYNGTGDEACIVCTCDCACDCSDCGCSCYCDQCCLDKCGIPVWI